ncbi:acetoacetate decarboxylase [Amorphus orientalis]|uniref:Acetoacetate decarboxylase n=1 Tax=Amorphus orientalis TaxID=649198 RepID=A0AAE3VPT6_9HYPH|nr:acetoacetate decarboxylase [Amorphus orientalis]
MISEDTIRQNAFAMPFTSPAFPKGPYRFTNREFFIVTYRTDPEALAAVIPAPLQVLDPIVKYEFIRMPDSNGFGDYTESGQVIPVSYKGERGAYVHAMYLDDGPPILGGRELWGFPKKYAKPTMQVHKETLVGTLDFGPVRVCTATMGYKHKDLAEADVMPSLTAPNFLLKIVPHVDGTARVCELVKYHMTDIVFKGAWSGPASIEFAHHALAPVAKLPVVEVLGATHILSDLTLGLGEVVHDYLA